MFHNYFNDTEEDQEITNTALLSPSTLANINNTLLSSVMPRSAMMRSSNTCDQSLWIHVYKPERQNVIDPCKTISGTVDSMKGEIDEIFTFG